MAESVFDIRDRIHDYYQRGALSTPVQSVAEPVTSGEKAFVSEVNGKMILTAPVRREQAATNPLFLNLHGRFVGAEKANRNGALWTTGDLEMGQPTVANGPLNWLHEDRYIIGALTKSLLVNPTPTLVATDSTVTLNAPQPQQDPYLAVDSVVWKWIYPHEAATIEMASEQGKLWYSMECISENVQCGECGESYPYMQAQRAAEVCEHIVNRTSIRRLENPTFLGGAVIVPPARPGWVDANLEVMKTGSGIAEAAYEQSGSSLEAREWEILMAQIVRFAS